MTSTPGGTTERPSVIVISDWLANCRAGQWTPFEAATALKAALAKEGYAIASSPDSKLEAYRKALEFYRDGFQFIPKRSRLGVNLSTWIPKEALLEDCGEVAKQALAAGG